MASLAASCRNWPRSSRYRPALSVVALVCLFLPGVFAIAAPSPPQPFFARVVSVTSANSLIVETESGERTQVVLAFLTIPFGQQPYAGRAREILSAQLLDRRVSVRPVGEPAADYQRGLIYVGTQNFNLDFLSRGHAWVDYLQVSHPSWILAHQRAKSKGLGLYADPEAVHPRKWATESRKANTIVGATDGMASDGDFLKRLRSTYVGNKSTRRYVSVNCLSVWGTWDRTDMVPILTVSGATADGYERVPCPSP